jgi:ATP-binding cassette subfamily C protein CydCD
VQTNSQLFVGTLRDNLCIKRPVETSDLVSLLARLGLTGPRFTNLDQAVTSAAQFSDGERARLSLARALLADVKLLFLDDIAGLFDESTLSLVRTELSQRPTIAVIEAAHDRRIIEFPTIKISLERK